MLGRRAAAAVLGAALFASSGCGDDPGPAASPAPTPSVSISFVGELPPEPDGGFDPAVTVVFEGAPPLRAEVARRPDQRARGLMLRTAVPDGTGMVFLFAQAHEGGFWMRGTLVPLSIAYVRDGRVVSVHEMTPCPPPEPRCPSYRPAGAYDTAVEAQAGFFPAHGVGPGTAMRIEGEFQPA